MPVGADVFEVKRRNACPVCVWGTPKPIRGHYFRGRERDGGTQRKEENDHEQRFLKETNKIERNYSEPIRKIAFSRLSFCSCVASRHIDLYKLFLSSKLEQTVYINLHGSE